jgi:hypothetical protein
VGGDASVHAATEVPTAPAVLSPVARQRVLFSPFAAEDANPVTVEWQTASAPRVEIRFAEARPYRANALVPDARCFIQTYEYGAAVGRASGSHTVSIADVYCGSTSGPQQVVYDSVIAPIVVTAYDSAYAEFALHGESVTRRPNGALSGAYGVFGSAASTWREIILIRQP